MFRHLIGHLEVTRRQAVGQVSVVHVAFNVQAVVIDVILRHCVDKHLNHEDDVDLLLLFDFVAQDWELHVSQVAVGQLLHVSGCQQMESGLADCVICEDGRNACTQVVLIIFHRWA